jgi:HAD superfamily hydrolase (TIGR01450 family)
LTTLAQKRLFLLDMDGTIYLSDTLFDGTKDFLSRVRGTGGRYLFLTNNSSRGTDSYIAKMARLGIETTADDFLTSADAAVLYLKKTAPRTVYYVCGTESLKRQLRAAGLAVADAPDESVGALLLGYDTELTYRKLEDCCILLNRGVRYLATHPDLVCPTWYGYAPDCGSVIAMLRTATGRAPETVIGKPQPEMALLAMEKLGCTKDETCLVGDRVYTDIACGVNAGIDTVFVLSGEGVMADLPKYGVTPTYVFPNIREVLNSMLKEEL